MDGFRKLRDDLEKVIEKEDSASSITTDSDDTSKDELKTFRQKTTYVLHTNKFQIIVICLVVLDSLFVIGELLFDLRIVELPDHENHIAPHILHYLSLTILGIFLVEIAAKIYALRLTYFHHKLELFDAVVVIVSFALDIVFRDRQGPEAGTGLLIILRLWRVTRIINGIVMSVRSQAEKKVQRERRLRDACEKELSKFREYCSAQESEIEYLRGLLRKHDIQDIEIHERPVVVSQISVIAEVNPSIAKINDINLSNRNADVPD